MLRGFSFFFKIKLILAFQRRQSCSAAGQRHFVWAHLAGRTANQDLTSQVGQPGEGLVSRRRTRHRTGRDGGGFCPYCRDLGRERVKRRPGSCASRLPVRLAPLGSSAHFLSAFQQPCVLRPRSPHTLHRVPGAPQPVVASCSLPSSPNVRQPHMLLCWKISDNTTQRCLSPPAEQRGQNSLAGQCRVPGGEKSSCLAPRRP